MIDSSRTLQKISHSRNRILVVDDHDGSAKMTAWTLEELGYEVKIARNGKETLDIVRTYLPDTILLDLGLPIMSGYEVCQILRKDPRLNKTVIIAQTGWGEPEHRRRTKEAGFDHHLVKPVDMWELQQLLPSA